MKHLNRKYFSYRAAAVARAQADYPARAKIILASEIMRLAFVFCGAALCALILWFLTVGASARAGGRVDVWTAVFTLLALMPTYVCAMVLRAFAAAYRAHRRDERSEVNPR